MPITFPVTLECDDWHHEAEGGTRPRAEATAILEAMGQIRVVLTEASKGWEISEEESDRGSYPEIDDEDRNRTKYFGARCPDHRRFG